VDQMKEHFHVENKREVKMKDYYEMDFFFFFFWVQMDQVIQLIGSLQL